VSPPVEVPGSCREEDRRDLPDHERGDDGRLLIQAPVETVFETSSQQSWYTSAECVEWKE
jgi:hypothetical protein